MIRAMLEKELGQVTNEEFKFACEETTNNIKAKGVDFKLRTHLHDMLNIMSTHLDFYRNRGKDIIGKGQLNEAV